MSDAIPPLQHAWFGLATAASGRRSARLPASRLWLTLMLAGCGLALVSTANRLVPELGHGLGDIDSTFALIDGGSGLDNLASRLWPQERALTRRHDGARPPGDLLLARRSGQPLATALSAATLPSPSGERVDTLTVGAAPSNRSHGFVDRTLMVFVTEAAKVGLVALLILLAARHWITRPLRQTGARTEADPHRGSEAKPTRDQLETLVAERTAELRQAKERAEAASEAKGALLSQVSHELRTPLNAVFGYAQLLRMEAGISERQVKGLDVIRQSCEHLLALIGDLLDLARIEAGRTELAPRQVELRAIAASTADIVRIKAYEKGLELRVEIAEDMPRDVRVDERRLRQVLLNLLCNAVKFTDHGEVVLRFGHAQAPGLAMRCEVIDTGVGIAEADRERLFLPFEQAGESRRRRDGTGLGLAISRQLVQQMGSDIRLDANPDGGSRFWFEVGQVVKAGGRQPADPVASAPRGYEGARRSVLVVDDFGASRTLLCEILSELGFVVHEADDGHRALELLAAERPDLVLIDAAMPVMDGWQTLRAIRADAQFLALPVLMVSAHASQTAARLATEAGANGFFAKPIEPARLLQRMAELLALRWTY